MPRLSGSTIGRLLLPLLLMALAAAPLGAQEFLYSPPKDYLEEVAKSLTLVTALLAMAVTGWVLLTHRKRLDALQSRVALFFGICVLPVPVMFMSTAVGLEQAKAVDFCSSCHVMRTFVADMEDPSSTGLAALHYRNRFIQEDHCYVCHTNYGLFGTVEAKVGGLTHIWEETTGTYQLPIRAKGGYQFTICLNCHGLSARFAKNDLHEAVVGEVLGGQAKCTDCHALSHPAPSERARP
jgi:nitrate/TMAO reductase-like tetraheme cytochrome c subunit